MDGWAVMFDTLGKFIGNVGVPVTILGMLSLALWKGAPWAGSIITRLVDAFTTFLERLNTAHMDMAEAVAKLAASVTVLADASEKQSSEILPRIQQTLHEVAAELRKKAT